MPVGRPEARFDSDDEFGNALASHLGRCVYGAFGNIEHFGRFSARDFSVLQIILQKLVCTLPTLAFAGLLRLKCQKQKPPEVVVT